MSVTVTIPTPKDVVRSVKARVKKTVNVAELTVLAGVKKVAYAVSDKAIDVTEKIDDHANNKLAS